MILTVREKFHFYIIVVCNRLKKFLVSDNFFLIKNTMQDISISRVGSIHDVSSERVLSSYTLLSLSASCLFIPADFWFVTFENVLYRTVCKCKMLCLNTQISFRDIASA